VISKYNDKLIKKGLKPITTGIVYKKGLIKGKNGYGTSLPMRLFSNLCEFELLQMGLAEESDYDEWLGGELI